MRADPLLFLAPIRPRSLSLHGAVELDEAWKRRWGAAVVDEDPDVALVGPLGRAPTSARSLVIWAAPAPSTLRQSRVRYRIRLTRRGEVEVGRWTRLRPRFGTWRGSVPGPSVTVVGPGSAAPAAVRAARPDAVVHRAIVSPLPRRRTVYAIGAPGDRHPTAVVKAAVGADGPERARREQGALAHLADIDMGRRVPRALGRGEIEGLSWSMESSTDGRPLARCGLPWWTLHGRVTADRLARWCEDLAVATRREPRGGSLDERGVDAAGRAREWIAAVRGELLSAPAVMTHGDLATALNVLVNRRRFSIIDWETSNPDGLPLTDLLPLLCLAVARWRRVRGPEAQASFIVELCSGSGSDSRWLFDRVERYRARLDLPPGLIGPLAAASWAHHGSMRVRHEEAVRAAGEEVETWQSLAELVLDRWQQHGGLGLTWVARGGSGRAP